MVGVDEEAFVEGLPHVRSWVRCASVSVRKRHRARDTTPLRCPPLAPAAAAISTHCRTGSGAVFEMRLRRHLPAFETPTYLLGAVALSVITVLAWWFLLAVPIVELVRTSRQVGLIGEAALLVGLVTLLAGSSLTYLVARVGATLRWRSHRPVPRSAVVEAILRDQPTLTVLIPSYKEEPKVVWRTVMSAALQEFPGLRVVVLIDDPPNPADTSDALLLDHVAQAAAWVDRVLGRMESYLEGRHLQALSSISSARNAPNAVTAATVAVTDDYQRAIHRLRQWASDVRWGGHESEFFSERVIGDLAADLDGHRLNLMHRLAAGQATTSDVHEAYRRLRWVFGVEVSTFERKTYASLSHEANKAMNINAYLGLMGGSYRDSVDADGNRSLTPSTEPDAWHIPATDYVLTLDADSALLMGYCGRLVEVMQRPENSDAAVIQTPYCAFPGPQSALERVAGATTDLLHVVHQGKTYFGATFWVGANAVIRMEALHDIAERSVVDGVEVTRFIQDRTVIEDTESTIDLLRRGWRLINYPERLAYSATPPDFGTLVIQRRRWANGGLLILPKLLDHVRHSRSWLTPRGAIGLGLQLNYLMSIAVTNVCLAVLLLFPFDPSLLSWSVLAIPIGYFVAMTWDLMLLGYRPLCAVRVYAMNLLLLPVNLAGVLMSIRQGVTKRKTPFARTPKIADRVRAPALYIVLPIAMIALAALVTASAVMVGRGGTAVVATAMGVLLAYALAVYVTPAAAASDVRAGASSRLPRPTRTPSQGELLDCVGQTAGAPSMSSQH